MQRISVTTLEKFRRFMAGVSSFDTEESLVASIKGVFEGNNKTRIGGAFHKLIEGDYMRHQVVGKVYYIADHIAFSERQARVAFDFKAAHQSMVHEIQLYKTYDTKYGPYQVSARTDGIEGAWMRDAKCKFRQIDSSEYMDSVQWRFYLDMASMDLFFFDPFEIRGFSDELPPLVAPGPHYVTDLEIIPHEEILCRRYAGMERDCEQLLNEFLDYIHFRKLSSFLKPALHEISLF